MILVSQRRKLNRINMPASACSWCPIDDRIDNAGRDR